MTRTGCLVAIAALAACGSNPKPAPPLVQSEASLPVEDTGSTKVRLIDAGAAPRRALRYAPVRGTRSRMDARMSVGIEIEADGRKLPIQIPPFDMSFDNEVTEVDTTSFVVVSTATAVGVDAGAASTLGPGLEQRLAKMVGMTFTQRLSRRGIIENTDATFPHEVGPDLTQMMDSVKQSMSETATVFPVEPIGVGARWVATGRPHNNAMTLDQTATYELLSLDGDRGAASFEIVQTGAPQEVQLPNARPGVKTALDALQSSGGGRMDFDLGAPSPSAYQFALSSDFSMTVTAQSGDAAHVRMRMQVEMTETSTPIAQ